MSTASDTSGGRRPAGHVGLTFDDGPNRATTGALLAALRAGGLRATMFNIGVNVRANPALARAQVAAGMWIGNHSWTHPDLTRRPPDVVEIELTRTQRVLQRATGRTPALFRPPFGATNDTVRAVQGRLRLTEVLWTVDSQDWNGASAEQIVQAARRLEPGGIMLMHDNVRTTIDAIPLIAADLRRRGLVPGRISPRTGEVVPLEPLLTDEWSTTQVIGPE